MSAAMTTILHVEDDPNDMLLFEHACRKAGVVFDLQAVSDGDQAIAYLRGSNGFSDRMKHPIPKLILLDLKMPRVSGFDVLAWLRSDELFKQVPVVVLTSSNHDADVKRAYDLGARSYLVKPVGFEALVELVKTLPDFLVQI
jgi:CheY-like chemotaxis protein